VTYHLAIGGAVGGGPVILTVLDGQTYRIRDQITTDWTEWRAAEAGIKLQEHGYRILPSSHMDHRRMAGWAVLAGIGFAVEVQELDQPAPTHAGQLQDGPVTVPEFVSVGSSSATAAPEPAVIPVRRQLEDDNVEVVMISATEWEKTRPAEPDA
jgi:hypothetical protein